jgi:hypothetical protein
MKYILQIVLLLLGCAPCVGKHTVSALVFEKIKVDISKTFIPSDSEKNDEFLAEVTRGSWDIDGIKAITTEDWEEAYSIAVSKLCLLAEQKKLDKTSLKKCLDAELHGSKCAIFPVAVYWCPKKESGGVWIAAYIWEVVGHKDRDGREVFCNMMHIRAAGYDSQTITRVLFFTCG